MSCPQKRSRSGCSRTSASSSPTSPEGQAGVDLILDRHHPELFQPRGLRSERWVIGKVRECPALPQAEGFLEGRGGALRIGHQGPAPLSYQGLEPEDVYLVWLDPEYVACTSPLDPACPQDLA